MKINNLNICSLIIVKTCLAVVLQVRVTIFYATVQLIYCQVFVVEIRGKGTHVE